MENQNAALGVAWFDNRMKNWNEMLAIDHGEEFIESGLYVYDRGKY
jgi:hypothetical protein